MSWRFSSDHAGIAGIAGGELALQGAVPDAELLA